MDDNIPNIFISAKLQEAFGLYWHSMKHLNNDIPDKFISELFNSTLIRCEVNYHDAKDIVASRIFCKAEHPVLDVLKHITPTFHRY